MQLRYTRGALLVVIGALQCLALIGCGGSGNGGTPAATQLTTRSQTIRPVALSPDTPLIDIKDLSKYATYHYDAWRLGDGEDEGRKFTLMPAGYKGAASSARLASFFSMSDIHITDKESPAQVPYFGWSSPHGTGGLYSQAYSPVMLSTTHVLNAAVQTINALHRQTPLNFGLLLGDAANSSQYNELRWFMDVVDGKPITPSSGAHLGADTIGYQKRYQAAGLDPTIPWYACIGNHDQYWMGVNYPNAKLQAAFVDSKVLDIGPNLFATGNSDQTGVYVGVVDGTSHLGEIIKGGPEANYAEAPTVVADAARHSLTTADSTTRDWAAEIRNSTSSPAGHGLDPSQTGSLAACYTVEPVSNVPLKVIVLDDTCKTKNASGGPMFYGSGWIDEARYTWLVNELQEGQDAGQLMIIAAHIPINPQRDLFATARAPQFYPSSYRSDAQLITTLHRYPNLIMLMAGHRHLNTVTPQPSPDPAHPENGFWEVETPSLRDFPQQFRTYEIRRNSDNTISILTTDVDPQVEPGTPAWNSRGYAMACPRIYGRMGLYDTSSHTYNAELVKQLTPAMQTKIAGYGAALEETVTATAAPVVSAAAAGAAQSATKQTQASSWRKSGRR